MTNGKPQLNFEQAFTELRGTVESLEKGNLSLEEATRLFERGMQLAKLCNELLSRTELEVSRLQRSFGEQMAMIQSAESEFSDEPDDGE